MWSIAANDTPESHYRIVTRLAYHLRSCLRKLPSSRHEHDVNVRLRCSVLGEALNRPVQKTVRDLGVKSAHKESDPAARGVEGTFRTIDV